MSKVIEGLKKGEKAIETGVVKGYKAIENGVVGGYKAIENGAVTGFTKVSDGFIKVLFTREGETVEEAKARMTANIPGNQKKEEACGAEEKKKA